MHAVYGDTVEVTRDGETVEATVIDVDERKDRLTLSLEQ